MLPIFCSIAISTLSLWQLLLLWQLLYCYYYSITIMTRFILFPISLLLLLFISNPLSLFLLLYFLLPYYLPITLFPITITYILCSILLLVCINISFLSLLLLKPTPSLRFLLLLSHVEFLDLFFFYMVPFLAGPLYFFSSLLDQPLVLKGGEMYSFICPLYSLLVTAELQSIHLNSSPTPVSRLQFYCQLCHADTGDKVRGGGENAAEVPALPRFRKHLHIRCNLGSFLNIISKPLFSITLMKATVQQTEAVLPTYLMPTYWVNLLFGLAALNTWQVTIPVWQVSFDVCQVVKANLICFSKDNKGFLELLYSLVKGTVYSSMFL